MVQPHYLIDTVHVGLQFSFTRTVTEDDLQAAMRLSGDHGGYHTDPDFSRAAGLRTTIVPGIFTAGLGTQVGGQLNLLAREITFAFLKPVYVGDVLRCTMTITAVYPERNRIDIEGQVVNQDGGVVLTSRGYGYLPRREWGIPRKPALAHPFD